MVSVLTNFDIDRIFKISRKVIILKINFYKSLLPYLPWLTFIFGVFHLIGDLGRQSGFVQLWNVGLFIALLSQQYC